MTDHETHCILSYLRERRQDMVDLLQRLALAESPSDNPAAVAPVLAMLASELEQAGMSVRLFPGRVSAGTLFARPRERNEQSPLQLLVGHCDTVWPVGTVRQMPVRVEGETLRGPGVFDMKGGLVQMLYALRAVKDLGLRPPADSVVVINSDEEIGSPDSTPLIRRLARRAVRAFILEPAFGRAGKLKTARKASGGFTITIKGRAAHAGVNPEEGASAILEMSHQIQRLFALNDAARGITVNVGTIDGGLRSNVVAAEVRASVDVRVRTRQDAAEVEAAIRGLRPVNPRDHDPGRRGDRAAADGAAPPQPGLVAPGSGPRPSPGTGTRPGGGRRRLRRQHDEPVHRHPRRPGGGRRRGPRRPRAGADPADGGALRPAGSPAPGPSFRRSPEASRASGAVPSEEQP